MRAIDEEQPTGCTHRSRGSDERGQGMKSTEAIKSRYVFFLEAIIDLLPTKRERKKIIIDSTNTTIGQLNFPEFSYYWCSSSRGVSKAALGILHYIRV